MMFSKPESPVSPLLYMLREIHRARDGASRQLIRPHPHQIQYRNRQTHIPLDEVEVQSIHAGGRWQKTADDCTGRDRLWPLRQAADRLLGANRGGLQNLDALHGEFKRGKSSIFIALRSFPVSFEPFHRNTVQFPATPRSETQPCEQSIAQNLVLKRVSPSTKRNLLSQRLALSTHHLSDRLTLSRSQKSEHFKPYW